jgi:hypothetical protein
MQKDFHHDIIFALAKETGYADANIIAYASQYVDDNTDREYTVSDSSGEFYVGFPYEIGQAAVCRYFDYEDSLPLVQIPERRKETACNGFGHGENDITLKN